MENVFFVFVGFVWKMFWISDFVEVFWKDRGKLLFSKEFFECCIDLYFDVKGG